MSANWRIGRQITACRHNRQQQEGVTRGETGVGNRMQDAATLGIQDN